MKFHSVALSSRSWDGLWSRGNVQPNRRMPRPSDLPTRCGILPNAAGMVTRNYDRGLRKSRLTLEGRRQPGLDLCHRVPQQRISLPALKNQRRTLWNAVSSRFLVPPGTAHGQRHRRKLLVVECSLGTSHRIAGHLRAIPPGDSLHSVHRTITGTTSGSHYCAFRGATV